MLQFVFSVLDKKAGAYLQPFFLPNEAVAVRAISDCVKDADHNFGRHPSDYVLVRHGTFDSSTGRFETLEVPAVVVELFQLANKGE